MSPYRARLAIEDIAQVSLGAGVDPFGAMAGGGLGLTLSDMLHTHWLVAAVQLSSPFGSGFSLRDVAGSVGYLNQARRWNWGVFAHVIPTTLACGPIRPVYCPHIPSCVRSNVP